MAEKLQPIRGTHDILPDEYERFNALVMRARSLARLYNFREMATPIFEATEVFSRSMGETSDVVSKEMFAFETKGGESVCLRPEFTAGIARSFISNGLQQFIPLKLFSTGALFRYERPQKGRQRQFHQVNYEIIGDASVHADVEIILLAGQLLYTLTGGNGVTLLINTLGDKESRASYREALVSYLLPHQNELSDDSKRRLSENPLRILDSKDADDKRILENAPLMTDYLSASSKARFDELTSMLQDVPYFQKVVVEPKLVRGLDYYTDTVFEFVAEGGELGAQNTVLAGGRYDGLIEQMGGKPSPAIGFAAGVERLLLLAENNPKAGLQPPEGVRLFILPIEEVPSHLMISLLVNIRGKIAEHMQTHASHTSYVIDTIWQGKLGKRMEKANKQGATHVLIIGEELSLKNMKTGEQQEIQEDDLQDDKKLARLLGL